MNNKLKLLYFTFFIFSFIALLFINSFYKFITVVKPDHNYTISAEQYYNFKKNVLNKIIDEAINETYLLKNVVVDSNSFTFRSVKTSIKFDLQINEFIDESELELRINKIYIGLLNKFFTIIKRLLLTYLFNFYFADVFDFFHFLLKKLKANHPHLNRIQVQGQL